MRSILVFLALASWVGYLDSNSNYAWADQLIG